MGTTDGEQVRIAEGKTLAGQSTALRNAWRELVREMLASMGLPPRLVGMRPDHIPAAGAAGNDREEAEPHG